MLMWSSAIAGEAIAVSIDHAVSASPSRCTAKRNALLAWSDHMTPTAFGRATTAEMSSASIATSDTAGRNGAVQVDSSPLAVCMTHTVLPLVNVTHSRPRVSLAIVADSALFVG
ncbi:MAG TPA: hypothetical protein VKP64_16520 [Mycobacteriales bacterium]|nr:hypothetical protein [Mycobacteriales bacterium]